MSEHCTIHHTTIDPCPYCEAFEAEGDRPLNIAEAVEGVEAFADEPTPDPLDTAAGRDDAAAAELTDEGAGVE